MKKIMSLFIAMTTIATMAVTAFADGEDTSKTQQDVQIVFGQDEKTDKSLGDLLKNGEEYNFPILFKDNDGNNTPIFKEDMNDHRFVFKSKEGKREISSIDVVKKGSTYVLKIETIAGFGTEKKDVSYDMKYIVKNTGKTVTQQDIDFQVGYETLSDENIKVAQKDEYIKVDSATPIITADQFDDIDDMVDGGKATFQNNNWKYEVKVTGQETVNFINSVKPNKTISNMFPNQQFMYLNFQGGSEFDFTGKLTIDVYDNEDDFGGNFYTYRFYKGRLTKIDATYDNEESTLTFNTKWLGNFIITDKEIKDGTVIEDGFNGSYSNNNTNNNNNNNNQEKNIPDTGALA